MTGGPPKISLEKILAERHGDNKSISHRREWHRKYMQRRRTAEKKKKEKDQQAE